MRNKEENKAKRDESPSFLNGLILGATVGAAGFFLFGTKKGKKVKKAILNGSVKTFEDLKKTAKDLEKKGKKLSKEAVEKKAELEKKANLAQKKATAELKDAERKLKAAREKAKTIKKHLVKKALTTKKRYFTKKGRSLRK